VPAAEEPGVPALLADDHAHCVQPNTRLGGPSAAYLALEANCRGQPDRVAERTVRDALVDLSPHDCRSTATMSMPALS
jgi:hypothetical protein